MKRLSVRAAARLDLLEQFTWLHEQSPHAAARLLDRANDTFEFLRRHPLVGRRWPRRSRRLVGVRVWPIDDFPNHLVFYRVRKTAVEILRIIHGARDIAAVLAGG